MAAPASPDESPRVGVRGEDQDGSGLSAAGGSAAGPLAVTITGEDWLDAICPFLRARDGSWRSASPAREHRCWATDPPSELPVLTQQRLCLVRGHDGCERFLHARELRSASLARDRGTGVDTPPVGVSVARTAPRRGGGVGDALREGIAAVLRLPRLALAGGVAAAALVVIAVLMGVGGGGHEPGPSPIPSVPVVRPTAGAIQPERSLGPDGLRRYRVRDGDTVRTIADRFGVSVRELRQVNELGDPPRLETGDVILIPDGG